MIYWNLIWDFHTDCSATDHFTLIRRYCYANNITFSINTTPIDNADKNIIIENIGSNLLSALRDFAKKTGKKFTVLVSEHLRLNKKQEIYINFKQLDELCSYIPNIQERFNNLKIISPYIETILRVGDVIEAQPYRDYLGVDDVITIPFSFNKSIFSFPANDMIIFFGTLNSYRKLQIDKLRNYSKRDIRAFSILSYLDRERLMGQCRLTINFPQFDYWKVTSPIRIWNSLDNNRIMIETLGTSMKEINERIDFGMALDPVEYINRVTEEKKDFLQRYNLA